MNPTLQKTVLSSAKRLRVKTYLVGGPVRDALLGRPCHDWDIAALHARRLAGLVSRRLRAKLITLDEQHQIFRVIVKTSSTANEERNYITLDFAEIQEGSIEKDLARRDFTINAMAQALGAEAVIDPFGGQRDLKKHVIRAVSESSFKEDPLRLLRAFRFAAQCGFKLEPKTRLWIRKHQRLLSAQGRVARERVREEFLRLLSQPGTEQALWQMDQCRLLTTILPALETCRRVAIRYYGRGGVLKHSLDTVANLEWIFGQLQGGSKQSYLKLPQSPAPPLKPWSSYLGEPIGGFPRSAWMKLGGLLHDIGKPATAQVLRGRLRFFGHEDAGARLAQQIAEHLRCSRQERQLLRLWVQNHMRPGNLAAAAHITDKAVARFFRDLREEGVGMLLISLADHYDYLARSRWGKGKDPVERMTQRMLDTYFMRREAVLPERLINGHQLMRRLRLKPGPVIGRLMSEIQDAQVEGKVRTPEQALDYARKLYRRKGSIFAQARSQSTGFKM